MIREAYATGAWLASSAGAVGEGKLKPWAVPDRHYRNSLPSAEIPVDRANRRVVSVTKKLPLLANIRDESAESIRVVLEPKNRSVDPAMLMESLFRATDLQSRLTVNLNVLTKDNVPVVMNLKQMLEAFLEHRFVVLYRQSRHRLSKIADRLEVLGGLLVAYLNIDEVIKIIREEDHPQAGDDEEMETDGSSVRSDPQHAAAVPTKAGRNRDSRRAEKADGRTGAAEPDSG